MSRISSSTSADFEKKKCFFRSLTPKLWRNFWHWQGQPFLMHLQCFNSTIWMAKIDSCYELTFWPLCRSIIANFCFQNKVGNTVLDAKKNIIISEMKKIETELKWIIFIPQLQWYYHFWFYTGYLLVLQKVCQNNENYPCVKIVINCCVKTSSFRQTINTIFFIIIKSILPTGHHQY